MTHQWLRQQVEVEMRCAAVQTARLCSGAACPSPYWPDMVDDLTVSELRYPHPRRVRLLSAVNS